ncbi:MAG: ABC transporter permease [Planctomycetes bacterium]|nr:ABC transporter permease [Planctomycetota bacterium]MCA8945028.1 ABC transporter permease [Planctomycetota bacterium]
MPWREVVRLLLKRKLAVACFAVVVICAFVALTAQVWVPDSDLDAKPGVDSAANLIDRETKLRKQELLDDYPDIEDADAQKQAEEEIAARFDGEEIAVTGLKRSYHPPSWVLAMDAEHPHWKETGGEPTPEAERDWGFFSAKAWRFPMGCDVEGVSILGKLIRGLQLAFIIGIIPTVISSIIAVIMGLLAGYFGKLLDDTIMFIISTMASIPLLLLLIAFIQAVRNSEMITNWFEAIGLGEDEKHWRNLFLVLIVIGLTTWIGLSRLVRAEVLKHKNREYIDAARALGYGTWRILFKHVLPNVFHIVIITFTIGFIGAVGLEVFLSYVGIGVEAKLPTWGQMISGGRTELQRDPSVWWPLTFATLFLFILSLAFSLFGDALRDALDPKLRT